MRSIGARALYIETILQSQRQELGIAKLAVHVALSLVAKLRDSLCQHLLVVSIVSIHYFL